MSVGNPRAVTFDVRMDGAQYRLEVDWVGTLEISRAAHGLVVAGAISWVLHYIVDAQDCEHNYQHKAPYQWECALCGRVSKTIPKGGER